MIDTRFSNLIMSELTDDKMKYWFDKKDKKFLHNIDTFYYSIKLYNNFTKDSNDDKVKAFRNYFNRFNNDTYDDSPISVDFGQSCQLNYRPFTFSRFYDINLECPEYFDIFMAHWVPVQTKDSTDSVTSEVIVQIRSYLLWTMGPVKAFEYSYDCARTVIEDFFGLEIYEVKENRIDYCWHTNYLQNPEIYLRIDNFSKMQVSAYKRVRYEYNLKAHDEYENDYISLGKRGDKCFLRMYLKTKEVVEEGYKPWFFKTWLFNELINRYDFYCLEEAFKEGNWRYVDVARLKFYLEHGSNIRFKSDCEKLLAADTYNYDAISTLADKLTPRITVVMNIEFQTTRKGTKSYQLLELKDNKKYGVCKRVYDYFDNHKLITDYLTHSTLRLVDVKTDSNKSRCDYTAFWKALRSTKLVDVAKLHSDLKLHRDYSRQLNKDIVKKRCLNSAMTYSLYVKGMNDDDVLDDVLGFMLRLNDNDIYNMKRYKKKKKLLLNENELAGTIDNTVYDYSIIDNTTGVVLNDKYPTGI